ncbi:MAG: DUF86 domain-containing protein [Limnochordaceae bacterium]|nr:DUF86 domain-containing protein [Limnochordaceae bacterium]
MEESTIRRLLHVIEHRLARLQPLVGVSIDSYVKDQDLQDKVERNLEVLIQACTDLGAHVLADLPLPMPESNRAVFTTLAAQGIIDRGLGERLARMAGFRNLLAHEYADLIPEKVLASLRSLDDVRTYVQQLTRYLRDQGLFANAH